jgi:hypothetical protein
LLFIHEDGFAGCFNIIWRLMGVIYDASETFFAAKQREEESSSGRLFILISNLTPTLRCKFLLSALLHALLTIKESEGSEIINWFMIWLRETKESKRSFCDSLCKMNIKWYGSYKEGCRKTIKMYHNLEYIVSFSAKGRKGETKVSWMSLT